MNKLNKVAVLFATAALATAAGAQIKAADGGNVVDNWQNGSSELVWKNGTNELCWRDANWTPATAAVGCDGALEAPKAAPAPAAAPPAAAPAPAPAPAPVAAQKVTYAADAFFDFDKSVLKPEGRAKLDDLVSKIKGAMIYPAFILAALGGVGLIMMVYVVPKITAILVETGGELPVATKILIGTSAFLVHWWWAIIIFLIAIFIGLKYLLRQPEPRKIWDHLKLKLPVFGSLFQRIYIVRFTRSMGTLVEGGVPITTSLNIVSDIVGNAFYKDIIDRTARDVQDGNPIASLFLRTKEIPPMIAHMLSVGEKTGRIGDVLNKMTDFYAREIEGLVANLVSLIEPLIMVIMGVGVGIMVAAVITPMYNMSSGF